MHAEIHISCLFCLSLSLFPPLSPPFSLFLSLSLSLYLYLDRSLSSHQDTNQDFPAAGPRRLAREREKKKSLIIDKKRGI